MHVMLYLEMYEQLEGHFQAFASVLDGQCAAGDHVTDHVLAASRVTQNPRWLVRAPCCSNCFIKRKVSTSKVAATLLGMSIWARDELDAS
jgi:hypothetical protein